MIEILFERAVGFGLYWGVWLLVPLLVDVSTAMVYFINFFINKNKKEEKIDELTFFPFLTVVVPVHNSADTLYQCLLSIANQSYPRENIQIICINNGSTDNSFEVFQRFQEKYMGMSVSWTSVERAGKSIALNAGIYSGNGTYIINIDADCWMDSEAIMNVIKTFEYDSNLVAATGSIRVDKAIGGTGFMDIINYCEIIEYTVAFDIGRRYQNLKDSIFTLSGAFSIFRRDIIMKSFLYQTRTVSEDTDLTFNIRRALQESSGRIGFVADALAYVEPIESLSRLYSQRLRWQRGEIEVTGVYYGGNVPGPIKAVGDFVGRILISDHTLALLRLAWIFLLPFLYLLGYPLPTLMLALVGMFVCYLALEICTYLIAYKGSSEAYQRELEQIWWIVFFMPFYRYLSYWFRMGGIILVLTETKTWKVENPLIQMADAIKDCQMKLKGRILLLRKWLRL